MPKSLTRACKNFAVHRPRKDILFKTKIDKPIPWLRQKNDKFDSLFKALVKRPTSSRKWTQVELAWNLRWVTKRTRKFPRKYTQVANKNILRQTILYFIG